MSETLRTIASATAKLRELLKESKKDLHRIRLLLDDLDAGLGDLWPYDAAHGSSQSTPFADTLDDADASLRGSGDAFSETIETSGQVVPARVPGSAPAAVLQLTADAATWKTAVALIASGRIVGVAAEADEALAQGVSEDVRQRLWLGDGMQYARWLGRGVVWMMQVAPNVGQKIDRTTKSESMQKAASQLLAKSLGIGYPDDIVDEVTNLMLLEQTLLGSKYRQLFTGLSSWEQRIFLAALLKYLAKLLNRASATATSVEANPAKARTVKAISGVAALLQSIVTVVPQLKLQLLDFLVTHPQSVLLARAAIISLPPSTQTEVLKKTWSQFGDNLHIQHTPILSQEANVCVLLLTAGYVHRSDPAVFRELARSGMHNSSVSEHLKASSERVRWLGMCVGMAISELVDDEGKKMDFGVDQTSTNEAKSLRQLVNIRDAIGSVDDLSGFFAKPKSPSGKGNAIAKSTNLVSNGKAKATSSNQKAPSKPKIIEVVDDPKQSSDEEEEEDDLIPYAKPDSDEPDSDEDANLVNRDKPEAPVYIRDLITNLSDTSNAPLHTLSLHSAAPLIRRKANFGTELHDHAEELAQSLVSLQDQFETDNWHDLRQAGLIALIIAEPKEMGPWLARTLFEGDLSISQRVAVVTAMGLGGRELAGFKADDDGQMVKEDVETAKRKQESWPTKKLPGKWHEFYRETSPPQADARRLGGMSRSDLQLKLEAHKVESLTRRMEQVMLKPVSTKERPRRPRTRVLKNDLATIVADYFFFPLTRYWQVYAQTSTHSNNLLQHPILTSLALKTLSILLIAAGPATTSLPQLTKELFSLLLSLRSAALQHLPILEAVLFALMTLLDVHTRETLSADKAGQRWLAEECGGPLVEFREWVGLVWEGLEGNEGSGMKLKLDVGDVGGATGEGDAETQRCKVLAASVLVRIGEIVQTYQRLLVGELSRV